MKKAFSILLISGFSLVWNSCKEPAETVEYTNDFNNTPDRVWIGEDFWSIPLEDWKIQDGRLECIGNRSNMKANLLTYYLKPGNGTFTIRVSSGLLHKETQEGTVGFSLGVKDPEDPDVKAACYHGKGFKVGVRTEGILFMEDQTMNLPHDFNWEHFVLCVDGDFSTQENRITLRVTDNQNEEIGRLEQDGVGKMDGLILLGVNHYVSYPFSNGPSFWFDDLELSGTKIREEEKNAFGAILWTMYTNSRKVLKLTAQLAPVFAKGKGEVHLQIQKGDKWEILPPSKLKTDSYTATFRIDNWDPETTANYRVSYSEILNNGDKANYEYFGTIRKEPVDTPLVLAGLTCLYGYGFPCTPLVKNLVKEDPDILYFSGDQLYEGNGGYSIIRFPAEKAILNYLGKWYMFGWAFGDLMKDRPTVCTPDDHDVFQGNLWGNGGRKIEMEEWRKFAGTSGGYIEPAEMINVVHATQCSHLPDPFDPAPMEQDITTWYTDMVYGKVSFAIISDRIFKSGPNEVAFWEEGRRDWIKKPGIDLSLLDKPGLKLIGDRQFEFLNHWMRDWKGVNMKVLLSQTIFANIPTHHGSMDGILAGDLDSGGWPQTPRNKIIKLLKRCYAFHISGDQHLPMFVRYGINDFNDAGWAYCTPAITVGYQRRFLPDRLGIPVQNRPAHNLDNTGEYIDGMGHKNYIYAVGNLPDDTRSENRYERAQLTSSGYGIITFNQDSRNISCDAIRFLADAGQLKPEDHFPGWPVVINQYDNGGTSEKGDQIFIQSEGLSDPAVLIYDSKTGELVVSVRIRGNEFSAFLDGSGTYDLEIGNPESDLWKTISNLKIKELKSEPVVVSF
ncbi:MAG: hypothetical protein JSV24_07400 [Bacteroidales bacterium]|nr:MAG: hypothetical protein JSV24_07400 [Bacteroidales bacterium]